MDALHKIESLVLSVAVTLLPVLVDQQVITAGAGAIAGAVLTGLATGLHVPGAVAAVQARRGTQTAADPGTGALEAEISAVAERILSRMRQPAPAVPDTHGERPAS